MRLILQRALRDARVYVWWGSSSTTRSDFEQTYEKTYDVRGYYIYTYTYMCVCVRFCFLKRIPTRSRVTTSRTHLKSFRVCARYKTRAVRCERFSGTRDVVLYYVSSATHTVPLSSFRFPNRAVVVRKS